jgi:hypothetical protein
MIFSLKIVLLEPKVDTNYFKGMYRNESAVLQPLSAIITSGLLLATYLLTTAFQNNRTIYYASYHVPLK